MELAAYKFCAFCTVHFNVITQYKAIKCTFSKKNNILMSPTCFEVEGSSSGRRLFTQLWYGIVCWCMHRYKQSGR